MGQSLDTDHDGAYYWYIASQHQAGNHPSYPALIFNLTQCDDTAILKVEVVPIQKFSDHFDQNHFDPVILLPECCELESGQSRGRRRGPSLPMLTGH